MKRLLLLLLLLSSFYAKAQQTYTISGTVSDKKGVTLPGVIVFITNTRYITSTDNAGKFSFTKLQPGSYEVVAKMIGFSPTAKNITIENKSIETQFQLKESNTMLNTVTIRATDPNYQRYLDLFTMNFIGQTPNASECRMLNPEVLNFHYDKTTNILEANANDFIIIENKALGYHIKYLLTKFEYNDKENLCTNTGYPYFEELTGREAKQKKWNSNREKAYLTSKRHFYTAVKNKTINMEGFSVYKFPDSVVMYKSYSLLPVSIDSLFMYPLDDKMDNRIERYFIYYRTDAVGELQETPGKGYVISGLWSVLRMADMTPLDYFVEPTRWTEHLPRAPVRFWVNTLGTRYTPFPSLGLR